MQSRFWAIVIPLLVLATGAARALTVANAAAPSPREFPPQVFLPHVTGGFCGPFRDTFDAPTGWYEGERESLLAERSDGEYRLRVNESGVIWFVGAPDCQRLESSAAVDARWAGDPGNFYGLLFATAGRLDRAYLLAVNSESGVWMVLKIDDKGIDRVVPPTTNAAVRPGGAVNRLAVAREGERIILSVNGAAVGELADPAPDEPLGVGLAVAAYTYRTPADARFDNFSHSGGRAGAPGARGNLLLAGPEPPGEP